MARLRDRLRRRLALARDVDPESPVEGGQEERSGGRPVDAARSSQSPLEDAVAPPPTADGESTQPTDVAASTPPAASPGPAHTPDAVRRFDPWGVRASSSSYDSTGGARRWVESFLGRRR
jgi:hypothetical protein